MGRGNFAEDFKLDPSKQITERGHSKSNEAAPTTNMRIHDLRHNFTSQLQAAGVSDSIIMAFTGHKTRVMLHRHAHANDEHKEGNLCLANCRTQTRWKRNFLAS